jgi:CHAT domain-containing protein
MAQAYDRLGEKQKAPDYYGQSLSLFRTIHDLVSEGRALLSFMEYWKELGKPSLAIFFGKQGIDRFQQIRRNIQKLPKEDQQSFVTSNQDYYRELAALLLAQGRLPEAEDVLGMLKEEEFKEFTRGQTGSAANSVASLTPKEQQAESILSEALEYQQLAQIAAADRTDQQKARYAELDKTLTENRKHLVDFWQALESALPAGEAHEKKLESSATQKLLRQLPAGTVVVYTVVLDDKLDLVVISRDAMAQKSTAVKRAEVAATVEQLRSAIRDRQPGEALLGPAHRLYDWLVTPIADELDGAHATTIAWSLDGVLRYIPVNVLHDGQHYLIERYTNVIFTPADTTGLDDKPNVTDWKALGLGVSKQYRSELNALPAVPAELRTIVRDQQDNASHGPLPGRILLDDAFTEQAMEQELQQRFPLVHIASHFVVGMTTDDSYLLLGGEKAGDTSGYQLRLSDVETMNGLTFDATALLSLSACETAMAKGEADGKEVDSLAAIGRQRGAQAVLASLWDVNDESTGRMMSDFYRRWTETKGMTKSEALREAQLALLHGQSAAAQGAVKNAQPQGTGKSPQTQNAGKAPEKPGAGKNAQAQNAGKAPEKSGAGKGPETQGERGFPQKTASPAASTANEPAYSHPYYWAPFILMGNWQ